MDSGLTKTIMESENQPADVITCIVSIVMALRESNLAEILVEKLQTAEGESYFSIW
jgi:hypothetical protein